MALMAQSAKDQLEERGTTEKRYIKKILRNAKHAVVLGADKRCATSGKPLQAESAASEI